MEKADSRKENLQIMQKKFIRKGEIKKMSREQVKESGKINEKKAVAVQNDVKAFMKKNTEEKEMGTENATNEMVEEKLDAKNIVEEAVTEIAKEIGSRSIPWTQKVELFSPCK